MQRKHLMYFSLIIIICWMINSVIIRRMVSRTRDPHNESVNAKQFSNNTVKLTMKETYCYNVKQLPNPSDILWRNNYYQFFINKKFNSTNYFSAAYFDNRALTLKHTERSPLLRINIVMTMTTNSPLSDKITLKTCRAMDTYIMYWITTSEDVYRVSMKCHCGIIFTAPRWVVNGNRYYVSQWECGIPSSVTEKLLNSSEEIHVSLVDLECAKNFSNYIKITVPKMYSSGDTENIKIALISKSWFGYWKRDFAPYLISWFEIIKSFGIYHIFAAKDALQYDSVIANVLQYYQKSGLLTLTNVPTNFDEVSSPFSSFSIDQIGMFLTINDVYYKNLYSFWYFLQFDIDEILVPKNSYNYVLTLQNILRNNLTVQNSASLACPMSLFYMDNEPGNASFPVYFPMFRQTLRQPYETKRTVNGKVILDAPKSFYNPKTCLLIGIHYCYYTYEDLVSKVEMDAAKESTLVHHYRHSCKKDFESCSNEKFHQINDQSLFKNINKDLTSAIVDTLTVVGYFKDQK